MGEEAVGSGINGGVLYKDSKTGEVTERFASPDPKSGGLPDPAREQFINKQNNQSRAPSRKKSSSSSKSSTLIIQPSQPETISSYTPPEQRMSLAKPSAPTTLTQRMQDVARGNTISPATYPMGNNVNPPLSMIVTNPIQYLKTRFSKPNTQLTGQIQPYKQDIRQTSKGTIIPYTSQPQINVNQLSPSQLKYLSDVRSGVPLGLAGTTTKAKINAVNSQLSSKIQKEVEAEVKPKYEQQAAISQKIYQDSVNNGSLDQTTAQALLSNQIQSLSNQYEQEVTLKANQRFQVESQKVTQDILTRSRLGENINVQYTAGEKVKEAAQTGLLLASPFIPSSVLLAGGASAVATGAATYNEDITGLGLMSLAGGAQGAFNPASKTINPKVSYQAGISDTLLRNKVFISRSKGIAKVFNPQTNELIELVTIQGNQQGKILSGFETEQVGAFAVTKSSKPLNPTIYSSQTKATFNNPSNELIEGIAKSKIYEGGTADLMTGKVTRPLNKKGFEALSNIKGSQTQPTPSQINIGGLSLEGQESLTASASLTDLYNKGGNQILNRGIAGEYGRVFEIKDQSLGTKFNTRGVQALMGEQRNSGLAAVTSQAQKQQTAAKIIQELSNPITSPQPQRVKAITPQLTKQEEQTPTYQAQNSLSILDLNNHQLKNSSGLSNPIVRTSLRSGSKQSIIPQQSLGQSEILMLQESQLTKQNVIQNPMNINPRLTPFFADFLVPPVAAPFNLSFGGGSGRSSVRRNRGGKSRYTADVGSALLGLKVKTKNKKARLKALGEEIFTGFEIRPLLE